MSVTLYEPTPAPGFSATTISRQPWRKTPELCFVFASFCHKFAFSLQNQLWHRKHYVTVPAQLLSVGAANLQEHWLELTCTPLVTVRWVGLGYSVRTVNWGTWSAHSRFVTTVHGHVDLATLNSLTPKDMPMTRNCNCYPGCRLDHADWFPTTSV